jgi:hypothetical protein
MRSTRSVRARVVTEHPSAHTPGGKIVKPLRTLTPTYPIDAQLFSDGTATGFFDCADLAGSTLPGDISGPITSWKKVDGKITLSGIAHTARRNNLAYTVAIQKFGGAGKGHWTLDVPC